MANIGLGQHNYGITLQFDLELKSKNQLEVITTWPWVAACRHSYRVSFLDEMNVIRYNVSYRYAQYTTL